MPAKASAKPTLNVFIAGVSDYPNLPGPHDPMPPSAYGMRKLSSPALSAFKLYRWIKQRLPEELPLPLGKCWLLISPSVTEIAAEPTLAASQAANEFRPCNLQEFMSAASQWREVASSNPQGMTWFYFAGHGVQRSKNDAVLLLQDFGQAAGGALFNAVDLNTIFNGMAPSPTRPGIAKTQMYFVDCCRILPEEFKRLEPQTPTQVFSVEFGGEDDRHAPIFFASISGAAAAGFNGRSSVFNELLIKCLDGSAGTSLDDNRGNVDWRVTSHSVASVMKSLMDDLNEAGLDQTFTFGGLWNGEGLLRKLNGAPLVDVSVAIEPDAAAALVTLFVSDPADVPLPIPNPLAPYPYLATWPAGTYRVHAKIPAHPIYKSTKPAFCTLLPPRFHLIRRVIP